MLSESHQREILARKVCNLDIYCLYGADANGNFAVAQNAVIFYQCSRLDGAFELFHLCASLGAADAE